MKKAKTVSIAFTGAAMVTAVGMNAAPAVANAMPTATHPTNAASVVSPVGHLHLSVVPISGTQGNPAKASLTCGAFGSASGTISHTDAVAACSQLLAASGLISQIAPTNSVCPSFIQPVSDRATNETWFGRVVPAYAMKFGNACFGNRATGGHVFNSRAYLPVISPGLRHHVGPGAGR